MRQTFIKSFIILSVSLEQYSFLTVLKVGSLRSQCQYGQVLGGAFQASTYRLTSCILRSRAQFLLFSKRPSSTALKGKSLGEPAHSLLICATTRELVSPSEP